MPSDKSQSKSRKGAAAGKADEAPLEPPSFEDALESLETLVAEMEGDDQPLEKMIVGYEEGVRLRNICERRLEEAQAKVEMIRDRGSEAVELENFDSVSAEAAETANGPRQTGGGLKDSAGGSDGELF